MKETVSQRLKQIMYERNLKQVDILRMTEPYKKETGIKLGKSTLSQYVNGVQSPDQDRYYLLSKTLNVSEPWLMGYDVSKERVPDEERNNLNGLNEVYNQLDDLRQRKVYNFAERQLEEQNQVKIYGAVAANPEAMTYVDETYHDDYITKDVPNNADGALVVNGNSMEPGYKNGSIVFYKKQSNVENGELAVVDIDGDGATFKQVMFDYDNEKIVLKSLNKDYPDRELEGNRVRIIGKVLN